MSKYIIGKFYMTFINGKPVAGYLRKITEYRKGQLKDGFEALAEIVCPASVNR